MVPLTHHEIVERVGPLARSGWQVDLPASDRLARRIAFRPREHSAEGEHGALTETLQLDDAERGGPVLTRTLRAEGAPKAMLAAEGGTVEELLQAIAAVPFTRQLVAEGGITLALSHRISAGPAPFERRLSLVAAAANVAGFTLAMQVPRMRGISAELELAAAPGDAVALPDDLFAVLGWPWGRLQRSGERWRAAVRVSGSGARLGRDAERKFARTAAHLATTLAEPPARFHARWAAARWRVAFRRAMPLLVSAGLIAGAAFASRLGLEQNSVLRMVIFQAPPLLLAMVFCLREIPRVELPRRPRPSPLPSWRGSCAAGTPPLPSGAQAGS